MSGYFVRVSPPVIVFLLSFLLETLRRLEPDVLSVLTHRDLTVGFILLWYSAVCTVESRSLFYLLFIYRFEGTRIDTLGIFDVNQTSMCLYPHQTYW